jgi:hypothetical protein
LGKPIYGQWNAMMVQGVLNRISLDLYLRTLELNTPGFFILRKRCMQTDYSKLNDRIVRQAWEYSNLVLNEELKIKLLQDKICRAVEMIQARENDPTYFKVKD